MPQVPPAAAESPVHSGSLGLAFVQQSGVSDGTSEPFHARLSLVSTSPKPKLASEPEITTQIPLKILQISAEDHARNLSLDDRARAAERSG